MSGSTLHIADSAVASLPNLGLGVIIAGQTSTEQFGRYGTAFALYSITFGVWRAFGPDTFLLSKSKHREDISASISSSLWIGFLCALIGGGIGVGLRKFPETQSLVLAFAVALPVLALRDGVRFALVGIGAAGQAIVINSLWLLLLLASIVMKLSATITVLWWAGSALISAMLGLGFLRWPPIRGGIQWIQTNRRLSCRFSVEFWINSAALLIVLFTIGVFAGLQEMGAYRAAAVLVGPVAVVSNGLLTSSQLLVLDQLGTKGFKRRVKQLVWIGLTAGVLTAVLVAITPDRVGEIILGQSWGKAQEIAVPFALSLGTLAGLMTVVGAFRALGKSDSGFQYRVSGLITIGTGGVFGSLHSAMAAAVGMTICGIIALIFGLRGFWVSLVEITNEPFPRGR